VEVTVRKVKDSVHLEIADNGKSFDETAMSLAKNKSRLGLLGMQERARLVSGRFSIKPRLGRGTTVRVVVPLGGPDAGVLPKRLGRSARGNGKLSKPSLRPRQKKKRTGS
jgi:signal transduction histidine kinase